MYQRQFLSTQPQTTAHLAQTMSLLSMNNGELSQEINKMLNENPALEKVNERRCPQCNRKLAEGQNCPKCSNPKGNNIDESIVFLSPRSDFQYAASDYNGEDYSTEEYVQEEESLSEYVLKQIVYDLEEDQRKIATYLLTLLDDDGFIQEDNISTAQYFHVPISKVEGIKDLIKRADPIGVGSAAPEEAMLTQLEVLSEKMDIPEYYKLIIQEDIETLSKKDYSGIAKKYAITIPEVKTTEKFILQNLNPYPGRASWGSNSNRQVSSHDVYTKPDIIVGYLNNDPKQALSVEIILPYGGNLTINQVYKDAMKSSEEEKKKDLKPDYEKANLFVKCLQQRNNTMRRLLEKIAAYQVGFIRKGEKYMTPLTRASLADELEVHESTISRAVSNKSLQLPDGKIIPLSQFFDRSLGIRAELKEIIANENKNKPLSDSKIAEELGNRGHDLARRTVAKYRSMEGILPAHMRKNIKQ